MRGVARRSDGVRTPCAARGFTLIEVLIALVVVSLVLAASMRAGGTMIVTQDTLRRATLAGWSAENALAEVRLPRVFPALGLAESPCPQLDVDLACVVEIRTTPNPLMRRVDVRVFDAKDRTRQYAHRVAFQASLP
jgi:general secretion pathway protein I